MNKKRKALIGLLWASVFALVFIFASWITPKNAEAACKHTYRWVVKKQPNCKESGYQNYECSKCGNTTNSMTLAPVPSHNWNRSSASCTQAKKCTRCNHVAENAKGHSYNRSAASCTEAKRCTRSGCGHVAENAKGHSYNRSAASCTEAKRCTRSGCGYVAENAKGHSYSWKIIKQPTSTETGYRNYSCSCGHTINSATIDKIPPIDINKVLSKNQYQIQASRVEKSGSNYLKKSGICNICALVNLLNRNLAADGLYSEKNKFDIEYVTRVSCLKLAGNGLTADSAKTMTCDYKTSLTYLTDKGETRTGAAVICDYDTEGYLKNPVFSIGNKNYVAVVDKISSDPKQQIIDLLAKNPEGVFVRGLYGDGAGHCFVITGYENGTFKVIDTATSSFTVDQPLNECWYSRQNNADLFKRIQYIIHLEETSTRSEIVLPGN